jgi:hypothetical protein
MEGTGALAASAGLDGSDGPATVVLVLHPGAPGRQRPAFSTDIRAAVLDLHPAGVVTGPFRVEVLIAAPALRRDGLGRAELIAYLT